MEAGFLGPQVFLPLLILLSKEGTRPEAKGGKYILQRFIVPLYLGNIPSWLKGNVILILSIIAPPINLGCLAIYASLIDRYRPVVEATMTLQPAKKIIQMP